MIDVNKEPQHEWERTLQELQREHDAAVASINRGHRFRMILLAVVVVLALIIMVF
jgi:hypothetical protein